MKWPKYIGILAVTLTGIIVHIIPFIIGNGNPLGYDTGFYRRYLIEPGNFLHSVPGLGNDALIPKLTFDIARFLHIPTNIILYGGFIALYAGITVVLYFLLRKETNEKIALVSALLLSLSPVSYIGFWYMLFKNMYGILVMCITALWIKRGSKLMYVGPLLLAITHQTTSIIFLLVLAVFFVINKEHRKHIAGMFAIAGAVFLTVHGADIKNTVLHLPRADFISWFEYCVFSFPLLLLAIAGVRSFVATARTSFFMAFAIVAIGYPLLHLPFYQRIFIFTDIAIVVIAAHGVVHIWEKSTTIASLSKKYLLQGAITILIFCVLATVVNRITHLRPLVSDRTMSELKKIDSLVPVGSYLITEAPMAPWAEGWSHDHIIAPGMLFDHNSRKKWDKFWRQKDVNKKIQFLNSFKEPLYLFITPAKQELFLPIECTEKLSDYILKDICQ